MTPNQILSLLWAGTAFVVSVTVLWVVYRAIHHAMATDFSFKAWIDDLSSVNFRMVVALGLFVITILVLLVGSVVDAGGLFKAEFDKEIIRYILYAIFGAMGWDVIGFLGKRITYKPGAPDSRREPELPVPGSLTVREAEDVVAVAKPEPVSRNLTDFTPRPA